MGTKVTFTLDEDTVRHIKRLAERSRKPQSLVVREAVAHYAAREQKLAPDERDRKLRMLQELMARPRRKGAKTDRDVDRELRDVRLARRVGWKRPSD
jgi:hypothetical protein